MGRMLGLGTRFDGYVLSEYVNRAIHDPIANVRAQRNIGELLGTLERIELLAEFPEPSPEFN